MAYRTEIKLKILEYKSAKYIGVYFDKNEVAESTVAAFPNIRISPTSGVYYIPYRFNSKARLFDYFRSHGYFVDYSELKDDPFISRPHHNQPESYRYQPNYKLPKISAEHAKQLQQFEKWLYQKRFSKNTVNTYSEVTGLFLRYLKLKKIEHITARSIEQFNYDFIFKNMRSVSYQNQCISGIKHYINFQELVIDDFEIERPKKDRKLPTVFSKAEVKAIFDVTRNLKHKCLLSVIYASGLRIGETLSLRLNDIDFKRSLIHIKSAKGRKDRYTILAENLKPMITAYLEHYTPKYYLFEGRGGLAYTAASARQILRRALHLSGNTKPATLHTLRHSFATHLLESGTDVRYIQELLGHNSPKTTMIYTHVSTTSIQEIKNPFDHL